MIKNKALFVLPANILNRIYGVVCVLFVSMFFLFLLQPIPSRDLADLYQQELPFQWYEFLHTLVIYSILPALIGTPLLLGGRLKFINQSLLIAMAGAGLLASIISYFVISLGHLDCDNNCIGAVPDNNVILGVVVLLFGLWVIYPIALFISNRKAGW